MKPNNGIHQVLTMMLYWRFSPGNF